MRGAHMKGLLVLIGVLAVSEAKAVAEDEIQLAAEGAERDPKLFSVFQIIQFPNDACNSTSGLFGTCYTSAQCSAKNLTADGTCASGFGVCCVANLGNSLDKCATGVTTVSSNNTYLESPGFPNGVSTSGCATARQSTAVSTYKYKIGKFSSTVTQMRLDFLDYKTDAPASGDCSNGTMTITGADSVTTKVLPTNLCGDLTDQHLYISVADLATTGAITISIALTSNGSQKWRILVRQFESSQTKYLAPRGCLQYHRANSGTLKSFNNKGATAELLNNHKYAICIADVANFCDVALTSSKFDLDAGSKITFGGTSYTGTTFGTSGAATWSFMGPYVATVSTTSANSGMNMGFDISYLLLPC